MIHTHMHWDISSVMCLRSLGVLGLSASYAGDPARVYQTLTCVPAHRSLLLSRNHLEDFSAADFAALLAALVILSRVSSLKQNIFPDVMGCSCAVAFPPNLFPSICPPFVSANLCRLQYNFNASHPTNM